MVLSWVQCMDLPECSWCWVITTDPISNLIFTLLFLEWVSVLTTLVCHQGIYYTVGLVLFL